jgi:hypothetical protein
MNNTITIASGFGCPKCGKPPTRRLDQVIACEVCEFAWGDGGRSVFEDFDAVGAKRHFEFFARCKYRPFLPLGTWPADAEGQRAALAEVAEREAKQERQAREREERESAAGKRIMDFLTEALQPVGFGLEQGDQIRIGVCGEGCVITADGVRRETDADIPF